MSRLNTGRRALLGAAAVAAVTRSARAHSASEHIPLWPAAAPGDPGVQGHEVVRRGAISHIGRPHLVAYRPAAPNGMAVIVIAGGGYVSIEAGSESAPTCRWLQSIGVAAFELIYRLPGDGWPAIAPFQDGQRAMRLIRARAVAYGIDPARIGVIGFSAGGHLAGMTAVQPAAGLYAPVDAADSLSARPDFAGLIYPVLSMMPPFDQTRARREIIGLHPTEAESRSYSVERHVDAQTPPVFLAQAADDPISPVENSLMMFAALRAAHLPAELHIFQSGGHGWGMGRAGSETANWPGLFAQWCMRNGWQPSQGQGSLAGANLSGGG